MTERAKRKAGERNSSCICEVGRGRNIKNERARERDEETGTWWHFSWYSVRPIGAVNPQQRPETDSWSLRGGWRCTHQPHVCVMKQKLTWQLYSVSPRNRRQLPTNTNTHTLNANTHTLHVLCEASLLEVSEGKGKYGAETSKNSPTLLSGDTFMSILFTFYAAKTPVWKSAGIIVLSKYYLIFSHHTFFLPPVRPTLACWMMLGFDSISLWCWRHMKHTVMQFLAI